MSGELLPGEARIEATKDVSITMTQREWAADILRSIAEAGEHGAWPTGISPMDAGRAVSRLLVNAPGTGTGNASLFALGWNRVEGARNREDEADPNVEALRFYADPMNWEDQPNMMPPDSPVVRDRGNRARLALRQTGGS